MKSIANFAIYCACTLDRHRKSMAISAWQSWSKLKAKVRRNASDPYQPPCIIMPCRSDARKTCHVGCQTQVMRRVEPHLAVLVALVPYLVAAWYLFTGLNLIRGPDRSNRLSSGLAEDETQEAKGATADVAAAIEVPTSPDDSSPENSAYGNETTTQVDRCCSTVQHCTTSLPVSSPPLFIAR